MKTKKHYILALMLCLAFVTGCDQKPEVIARDTIAASRGVLITALERYEESCKADPSKRECLVIDKAFAAHNTAVDALHIYCASDSYENGGPCTPNKQLEPKLRSAITKLNQIKSEVEVLIK